MKKFKISNDEVAELSNAPHYEFQSMSPSL